MGVADPTGMNLLKSNGVHSQEAMHGAYSDGKQLQALRKTFEDALDEACELPLPAGVDRTGEVKHPGKKVKVVLAGDGAPSIWWLQNPSDKSVGLSGKFHLMQNTLMWIVAKYEKVLVDLALHVVGRKSEPQKLYLKGCADPDLALQFFKELKVAFGTCVVTKYMSVQGAEGGGGVYPLASTLDDWVWELAEGCPALCALLRCLVDLDLVIAMDNCERSNNPDDYKYIIPCIAELAAQSNALKYLPLFVAEMIFLETCSFAELEIFRKKLFTFNTVGGTSIYLDRFVEWTIKALKAVLGKTFTSERLHRERVNIVTSSLDHFLDSKSPSAQRRWEVSAPKKVGEKRRRERKFRAGKSFWALMGAIEATGMLDAKCEEVTCLGGGDKFKRGAMQGPSGAFLTPAFFDTKTGGDRVAAHMERQIQGGRPSVGKTELAKLKGIASDAEAQALHVWKQKHSEDITFILQANNITKPVMLAELTAHSKLVFGNPKRPEDVFPPGWERDAEDPSKVASKEALGKLLALVRGKLHEMRKHRAPALPKKLDQIPRGTSAAKLLRANRFYQNLCIGK